MPAETRKPRKTLNEKQVEYLYNTKFDSITKQWLRDTFAITDKGQFMPWDGEFVLDPSRLQGVQLPKMPAGKFKTTSGRYIFNLFLFGNSNYANLFSYFNEPVDSDKLMGIQNTFLKGVLEKVIKPEDYVEFLNREVWLSFSVIPFALSGLNTGIFNESKELLRVKNKLLKENKEKLDNLDLTACSTIDKKCNEVFMKENENNTAIDFVKAGTAKKFVGVTTVMRGLVPDSTGDGLRFISSSLQGGIKPDEVCAYADTGILGAKSRGLETRNGGYLTKKFNAAFSHLVLDEPGSDCKTKYKLKITITKDAMKDYYLRYATYQGKEYILDTENINKLMGKEVYIRSPMYCMGDKICNKCAGDLYYRMDNRYMGLAVARIGSNLLNASLKKFHDSTIKITEIDIEKYARKLE